MIAGVEVIDVDAAEPRRITPFATERIQEAIASLPDGRVIVAGGIIGGTELSDVRIYNASGSEVAGPSLSGARRRAQMVVFDDGDVLIAGGFDSDADYRSAERFTADAASTTFAGSWRSVHRDATLTRVGAGTAIAVGGLTYGNAVATETEVYAQATGRWDNGPDLTVPRIFHGAAALSDGRVLIVGGEDAAGGPLADVEILDLASGTSTAMASLPVAITELHVTVLPGDVVVVTGGRTADGERAGASAATFVYDVAGDVWGRGPDLNVERYGGRLVTLTDGRAVIVGGSVQYAQTTAAVEILELASE